MSFTCRKSLWTNGTYLSRRYRTTRPTRPATPPTNCSTAIPTPRASKFKKKKKRKVQNNHHLYPHLSNPPSHKFIRPNTTRPASSSPNPPSSRPLIGYEPRFHAPAPASSKAEIRPPSPLLRARRDFLPPGPKSYRQPDFIPRLFAVVAGRQGRRTSKSGACAVSACALLRKQREFSACGAPERGGMDADETREAFSGIERFACEVLRERGVEGWGEGGRLEADRICGINRCCWDLGGAHKNAAWEGLASENCGGGGKAWAELQFGGMDKAPLPCRRRMSREDASDEENGERRLESSSRGSGAALGAGSGRWHRRCGLCAACATLEWDSVEDFLWASDRSDPFWSWSWSWSNWSKLE